jgi:hypothetical protein
MAVYENIDILVSASGDLSMDNNGDFSLTSGQGVVKQDIAFRLRTNLGEFVPHIDLGAGLDEIIGEPNTRETSKVGETKINKALTYDGMISNSDLYIRGVPISNEAIMYYLFVNNGRGVWNVTPEVVFNLTNGLTNMPGA